MPRTPMFPIPRITESFIDGAIDKVGWKRYEDLKSISHGRLNADYIAPDSIIELKVFEEEGLDKENRRNKVAELLNSTSSDDRIVDISLDSTPLKSRRKLENIVSKPIQNAVKKASKQILQTKADLDRIDSLGVLIAVNNEYNYLNADNFEKIVVQRCKNDSSNIDYALCVTVDYHQGDFDAYVFCTARCHAIKEENLWINADKLIESINTSFAAAMTDMMANQMNPDFWDASLPPVSDIRFERDGVIYIRAAPPVPDSRFTKK